MRKMMLLIVISIITIGCENDDDSQIEQLNKSESYNQKIKTSNRYDADFHDNELINKSVGDTIPDKDVIHWHH